MTQGILFRSASPADAAAIHRLIAENLEAGHLLPRSLADIEQHASRFVVAEACARDNATRREPHLSTSLGTTAGRGAPGSSNDDTGRPVVGCAELAPLSQEVAEVRSLVVDERFRGRRIGAELVARLAAAGARRGFATLCAFTHEPVHFVRLGFTIVPDVWVPEKIAHDCNGCALFRRCGQYAVTLPLRSDATVGIESQTALSHPGDASADPSNIDWFQLRSDARDDATAEAMLA